MIDNLDIILAQIETVLTVYAASLVLLLGFVVIGGVIERYRRSPVEKMLRRRFG